MVDRTAAMKKCIGIILLVISGICLLVGRSLSETYETDKHYLERYRETHPVSTFLFGAPMSEEAKRNVAKAGGFVYIVALPHTSVELLICMIGVVGVILFIWGDDIAAKIRARNDRR
jgi:hypothetical protein